MAKRKEPKRPCATATIDGKRKFFYADTIRDAENKRDAYLYELEHPIIKAKRVIEEWEEIHEQEVTYKTWLGYQTHIKGITTEFAETDIKEIGHLDIARMLQRMGKQDYAQRTVRTRMNVLNMIMVYAMCQGYIDTNPCELAKIPKGLKKTKRELPEQNQINRVKNGLDCHFGLFAYFLLYTGLRRGEALAIEWKDIDFKNNLINVDKAIFFKNNKPELKSTKTESGTRTVPLLTPLRGVLQKEKDRSVYLFGKDKMMTEQALRRAWEHYCKDSGVTITPHQLRHAFATILFDAEISSKSAQKILGHADYKTTMEIYTHISEKREVTDTKKLNKFLKKY